MRALLLRGNYDIVHAHSPFVASGLRLLLKTLPAESRPKMVTTEHNAWGSYRAGTRLVSAATMALDDAHIAVSLEALHSMPESHRERVEVIVHGILVEEIRRKRAQRAAVRAELGIADHEVLVGTVANLRAQKAYPDLLAAARRTLDTDLPVRFVAIGQGPLEDELHALHADLGLGDGFRFLGFRPDAPRVLAGCDLFALSSVYEGYPIAVMEALAVGLPIVATAVGGVPDAVRHGREGLVTPPQRPDLLADGIIQLARDGALRARMSEAAQERGFEFDITRAIERIEAIYREVLAGRDDPVAVAGRNG
jgi:glycosyltransferase involved in cell wall biosynthesis